MNDEDEEGRKGGGGGRKEEEGERKERVADSFARLFILPDLSSARAGEGSL